MNAKKLLVSFSLVVSLLFMAAFTSAQLAEVGSIEVEVNSIELITGEQASVIAGEIVPVKVTFTADVDASDVRIEAELVGDRRDFDAEVFVGDIEDGVTYVEFFNMRVPYGLDDEVSSDMTLNIEIKNSDEESEFTADLRVQRPSYNTGIMAISSQNTVDAGESFPVDVVLKNIGYNELDDVYVRVSIPELNIERADYFGDIVALETDPADDNYKESDTVRGRLFLEVPFDATPGIYTLEVEARNSEMSVTKTRQIFVENVVPETVLKSGSSLVLLNPTNRLMVYTIVTDASVSLSDSVVAVPAGSSRTVNVMSGSDEGFSVTVLSGGEIVSTVEFSEAEDRAGTGIAVLTVILAIIFVVLLVVLIVLLTKKPEEKEELEESYY